MMVTNASPLRRPCLTAGAILGLTLMTLGETFSPTLSICTDPDGDPRWNAVGNGCASLALPWPERAASASVTVSNLTSGATRTVEFADRTSSLSFDVPTETKGETAYSLTATFAFESNRKETFETSCVVVRGLNGATVRTVTAEPGTLAWRTATRHVVLPTDAASDAVTREGNAVAAHGLWRVLARLQSGDTRVSLNALERILTRNGGLLMLFR